MNVPRELEDAVYAATASIVGDAALATAPLTRAIVDRSKRYTSDRDRLSGKPAGDLAARAAFFTPADAMKIAIPIGELANRGAIPARRPLRVVDLGAGCGALSLGLIATLESDATGGAMFDLLLIDSDMDALRIASAALRDLTAHHHTTAAITTRVADVTATSIPPADLILAGSVLNELPEAARMPLVQRALAALAPDGALILIEPALRDTSRALHAIRDAAIAAGACVFAPCTRQAAPCPMLENPDDWCHEDRPLTLPPRTAELARLTHLRDSGMKFSYLVLRKQPLRLVDRDHAWRIVSEPLSSKGKLELYGCSDAGRIPLRLLRRNRSEANRAFEKARRGDVVVTESTELDRQTPVERVEPAEWGQTQVHK
jgi:ribosomal protein RSM22 (predicted rRNA methylase)